MGVLLYLMIYGDYPFNGSKDSEIIHKIIKEEPKYPSNIETSLICKLIIQGMLEKNQQIRLELSDPIFEKWYRGEEYYLLINN
jgi:serine/threonine protein kinase